MNHLKRLKRLIWLINLLGGISEEVEGLDVEELLLVPSQAPQLCAHWSSMKSGVMTHSPLAAHLAHSSSLYLFLQSADWAEALSQINKFMLSNSDRKQKQSPLNGLEQPQAFYLGVKKLLQALPTRISDIDCLKKIYLKKKNINWAFESVKFCIFCQTFLFHFLSHNRL